MRRSNWRHRQRVNEPVTRRRHDWESEGDENGRRRRRKGERYHVKKYHERDTVHRAERKTERTHRIRTYGWHRKRTNTGHAKRSSSFSLLVRVGQYRCFGSAPSPAILRNRRSSESRSGVVPFALTNTANGSPCPTEDRRACRSSP